MPPQQNQLPNGQQQQTTQQTNNNGDNDDSFVEPFDPDLRTKLKKPDASQQQQQQTSQQHQQTQQPQDVAKMFNDHINSLDFGFKVDAETMTAMINEGNTEGFVGAINSALRNVYKTAILDAQKMMAGVKEAAVSEAKKTANQSITNVQTKQLISEHIPLYKTNPGVAPIIESSVSRYMQAGLTAQEAIDMTKKYMKKLGNAMNQEGFVDDGDNNGRIGQQSQRRGGPMQIDDWVKFAQT